MFIDEGKGNDNESSDEDAPAENQSQVPQNAVHWSSTQREIDVEFFYFGMVQPEALEIMLQRKISSNNSR